MTNGRDNVLAPPAGDSAAANGSPVGPATGPVLLWILVQLAALSVAALRIPLAAKYPQPAELLATHVVLAVQVAAAALLFPFLMRDWRTAAAVIATAWPFAAAASVLSAVPMGLVWRGEAYVMAWLVALALWSAALPGLRASFYGVAVAAFLSIGAAAIWYLALEFNPSSPGNAAVGGSGERLLAATPLIAAMRQLAPRDFHFSDLLIPPTLITTALAALLARRFRARARANLSTARAQNDRASRPITP